jgi:hypothetical protein
MEVTDKSHFPAKLTTVEGTALSIALVGCDSVSVLEVEKRALGTLLTQLSPVLLSAPPSKCRAD